jgi:hypothetical protein
VKVFAISPFREIHGVMPNTPLAVASVDSEVTNDLGKYRLFPVWRGSNPQCEPAIEAWDTIPPSDVSLNQRSSPFAARPFSVGRIARAQST